MRYCAFCNKLFAKTEYINNYFGMPKFINDKNQSMIQDMVR